MRKGERGGKATAIILRKQAIEEYYKNPNYCKCCKRLIEVKDTEKVHRVKIKKFCTCACAAKYHQDRNAKKTARCDVCNKTFDLKYYQNNYIRRKRCDECKSLRDTKIDNLTKGEFFKKRKNYQSARSSITRRAYQIYIENNLPKKCLICGYAKHFHVSHIKPVSEFMDNELLSTINNINNLIALCPTHHWELDHDGMSNKNKEKIQNHCINLPAIPLVNGGLG